MEKMNVELVERAAPLPAVGRTRNRLHPQSVVSGVPARIAGHNDVVPGVQGFSRDALAIELSAAPPFNGPALNLAVLVRSLDVHERVRVSEEELNEVPFDRHRLIFEVCRSKRVMGLDARPSRQRDSGNE